MTDDFKALIAKVATGASLTREEAASAFDRMMSGEATPSQMGGLLMALRVPGRGEIEEILQQQMAVLGGDAFRMELHPVHRQARMREPHHQAVIRFRVDEEIARHARALDHQRMIARGAERPVDAAKHARACVLDLEHLAVLRRGAHDLATKRLADGLMAEANAEDRNARRRLGDEFEADAGFVRRARAGRQHDRFRLGGDDLFGGNFVVAMHDDVRSEPAQVMEQVEGETVVVVDQNDHDCVPAQGLKTTLEGGQAGVIFARSRAACRAAARAFRACGGRFPRWRQVPPAPACFPRRFLRYAPAGALPAPGATASIAPTGTA